MKLEKDGFIELHLPDGRTDEEEATLSGYTTSEFMIENKIIWIKILPSFYSKYFFLNLISFSDNKWNYVNPFWILWNFFKIIFLFFKWLWVKSKIVTVIVGLLSLLGGLLVYDWSLAWKNLKVLLINLGIL